MPANNELTRRGVSIIAALVLLVTGSGVVLADALPTKLTPGDGAVLADRPSEVSIEIGEDVSSKAGDNDLVVRDSSGSPVTAEHATVATSHRQMTLKLPVTLPVGTYTVQWFAVSAHDGHASSGQWKFTYDPTKTASSGTQPSARGDHADEHADEPASSGAGLLLPVGAAMVVLGLLGAGVMLARRRG